MPTVILLTSPKWLFRSWVKRFFHIRLTLLILLIRFPSLLLSTEQHSKNLVQWRASKLTLWIIYLQITRFIQAWSRKTTRGNDKLWKRIYPWFIILFIRCILFIIKIEFNKSARNLCINPLCLVVSYKNHDIHELLSELFCELDYLDSGRFWISEGWGWIY